MLLGCNHGTIFNIIYVAIYGIGRNTDTYVDARFTSARSRDNVNDKSNGLFSIWITYHMLILDTIVFFGKIAFCLHIK